MIFPATNFSFKRKLPVFSQVLKKMSLMALLGVLTKYIVQEPLAERVKEAVADVRNSLPQMT